MMNFNTTTKKPIMTVADDTVDDAAPVDLKASGHAPAARSLADNKRR